MISTSYNQFLVGKGNSKMTVRLIPSNRTRTCLSDSQQVHISRLMPGDRSNVNNLVQVRWFDAGRDVTRLTLDRIQAKLSDTAGRETVLAEIVNLPMKEMRQSSF